MVLIFTKKNKRVTDESEDDVSIGRHALSPDRPTLMAELDELPQLRDYPAAKREALFEQKLELCSRTFNFDDVRSPRSPFFSS